MPDVGHTHVVRTYLQENAGREVSLAEVKAVTGLSSAQVSQILHELIQQTPDVTRLRRGVFRYEAVVRSIKCQVGDVFECAGFTPGGTPLVRSASGVLFRLMDAGQ